MSDVNRGNRPLSPHLQIYRMKPNMLTSILNRITGSALLGGGILVVWWFLAAATGPEYFAFADGLITSWLGDLVMLGSLWALWFHTAAGVRHLLWDTGRGLDVPTANKLDWAVIIASVVLTFFTLIMI